MTKDRKGQNPEIADPNFPNIPERYNIGADLLAKGQTIVYSKEGLPSDVMIEESPDGRKVLIKIVGGEITEIGDYVED